MPEHPFDFTEFPEGGPTVGGGFAGSQIGREFVINDRVVRLIEQSGEPGRGAERIDLPLGGGEIPATEGTQPRLVWEDVQTGQIIGFYQPGAYQTVPIAGKAKVLELDAEGNVRPGGTTSFTLATAATGAARGRTFAEERQLLELSQEFTSRRDRLQQAATLTRDIIGLQAQAKELVATEFGRAPVRGAILAQGRLPRGRSPQQAFLGQLRETATQTIPQAVPGETPEQLEGRISALEAIAFEETPRRPLGLAHGGVISPAPGEGVLVGEAGRPEVIRPLPQGGFEVIPLAASAQGGAQVESPFGALTNVQIADALSPVFEAVGLRNAPVGGRNFFGQFSGPFAGTGRGLPSPQPELAAETFEALGTLPSLIQEEGTGQFFFRDPQTGAISDIGTLAQVNAIGFSPQDAVVLARGEIEELATGGFTGETFTGGDFVQPSRPFAARATPIFLPLGVDEAGLPDPSSGGLFLPDTRQLAGVWNKWDAATQDLVASAYEFAGVPRAKLERDVAFFSRAGTPFVSAALR